ncbi:DUF418 domain-containing protein [Falsibacillus pallidus]|uniref:DUF418 domain-containing protein n=1 Tax=Falsibacillus pallidus TaxID=493781 RepID=UPI003D9752D1
MEPISSKDRILSIDILRGLALVGIFIVNIISFHTPVLYINPFEWWEYRNTLLNYEWIDIFLEGSVYPIFALLFGFGLAVIRQRAVNKGESFSRIGSRRLVLLLFLGALHAIFIWFGDILINYALLGFLLMTVLSYSGRRLIYFGLTLLLIPNLLFVFYLSWSSITNPYGAMIWTDIGGVKESIASYTSTSYFAALHQRLIDWYAVNNPANFLYMLTTILPMMLIGAGAFKTNLFLKVKENKGYWIAGMIVLLCLGILLKSLPYLLLQNNVFLYIQDIIGGPITAMGYIAAILLIVGNPLAEKMLKPLAAAGRMSLTIYLMQSILSSFIFYGYGMGMYNKLPLETGVWVAIGIFMIQVILAEIWFSKFTYGPLESIWRKWTYR